MSRKPRTDSRLKTLPPGVQEKLFALLRTTTYRKAVPVVAKEFGVQTSVGALSDFFGWYPLSRQLEQAANFAEQLEKVAKADPQLVGKSEEISRFAQIAFEARAVETQDAELFIALRKGRHKDAELALRAENQALRLRQYEEKMASLRATLEKAKNRGGVSPDTLQLIEEQLKLL